MNAVEIEAAVSELAEAPFDPVEFPYAFLAAFGNKDTTLARLRKGETNKSDIPGGVLQRNNIHVAVAQPGTVGATLEALRASPETAKAKAKFILATDGVTLEAEDIASGETIASAYRDFAGHFGFFLPLAGISTIKEIKDSAVDIRATGRLNKLYLELLKENPEWASEARRPEMNHFMARLIFCFFAEDTGIFEGTNLFTSTVDTMSESTSANTHEVLSKIFHAMNVPSKSEDRKAANIPAWADKFPYVNGGLFSGSDHVSVNAIGIGDGINSGILQFFDNTSTTGTATLHFTGNTPDLTANVGQPQIINTAEQLQTALQEGFSNTSPQAVGHDHLVGGDGNDILFGDVINTDALSWTGHAAGTHNGAGYQGLVDYLTAANGGAAPSQGQVTNYIVAHAYELNVAGDTRGGNDTLEGGKGDEFVTLKVMLPPEPDPELEAFLSRWSPATSYDPRRDMQS